MSRKSLLLLSLPLLVIACDGGFERFAPPSNSISGRGAKQNPKIISSTPADGSTISPVTGVNGTQITVTFDMTMQTTTTPVIYTYVRDISSNSIVWYNVENSGVTFTWSSSTYANDTLTIQLGWVRWPENNIIGFDFDNNSLKNLDDMPLDNSTRFAFTVGWNPGRYKVVHTGQSICYRFQTGTGGGWKPETDCRDASNGSSGTIGSYDYPAGQNGFIDAQNTAYVGTIYPVGTYGGTAGKRFVYAENPGNIVAANCTGNSTDACYPYAADSVTTLVWKTCSQGQYYYALGSGGDKCWNSGFDYTWGQAVNACASLNAVDNGQGYAGRKDWRLPTVEELEGLVDYGAHLEEPGSTITDSPAIQGYDPTYGGSGIHWMAPFPNTLTSGYWTATGVSLYTSGASQYGNAFVVEFLKGAVGVGSSGLLKATRATSNRKKVRCVAGPTVAPPAQNLVPKVLVPGASLATTAATFTGYDANATFNITSMTSAYNMETGNYELTLIFNKDVNQSNPPASSQGGATTNYCIAGPTATSCAVSSPTISTATVGTVISGKGNVVTLVTGTQNPNQAYQIFVSNVTSATGALPLTTNRILFSGATSILSRAAAPVFNVKGATSPDLSSIRVTFDAVPNSIQATNTANYRIISAADPTFAFAGSTPVAAITGATLSGRTVTLTTSLTAGTAYAVMTNGITYAGAQVVEDTVNKLLWQRCRYGVHETSTCADDGDGSNDILYWNEALNYCASLNANAYAGTVTANRTDPFGWRAPTINELKSIANRSLAGTIGYAIDTTIFPTPNPTAEDFASSTNYSENGSPSSDSPSYDKAWAFNFFIGGSSALPKDHTYATPPTARVGVQKNIRCVRRLP